MIIFFVLRLFLITYPIPTINEAKIVEIKESYVIGKVNKAKVLIYGNFDYSYDDIIAYQGYYEEIYAPKSKFAFQFDKYLYRNRIKYQIKAKDIKLVKNNFTLRSHLYNKIKRHPNHQILNKLYFNINFKENDLNILDLLASSKVLIRSLILIIIKLLSKVFYKDQVFWMEIFIYIFFIFVFKEYLFYLNILFYIFFVKLKYNQADAHFLSSSLILFLDPFYMFSLTFIVHFFFRLLSLISTRKINNFWRGIIVILPIQLRFFSQANLLDIILYPYYRKIGVLIYLLGFIDITFQSQLVYKILTILNYDKSFFTVTGHLPFILFFWWLFFALLIVSRPKMIYKLALFVLLFINQNQLAFNPNLVYTQLYVGQGDAAIIRYPFSRKVLFIDTGPPTAQSKIVAYLNYYGIKMIDSIIISHDDLDHSGNFEYLTSNFKVKNIVKSSQEINFHKLKIYTFNYDFGDDNENSLISYFKINGYTYLSLADVTKAVEIKFIKDNPHLKPNIVKLGHHGSNTSSSSELLELESIILLLNSCGYQNIYKHPHPLVKERIKAYNLPFIDTSQVGDISIIHFLGYNFLTY